MKKVLLVLLLACSTFALRADPTKAEPPATAPVAAAKPDELKTLQQKVTDLEKQLGNAATAYNDLLATSRELYRQRTDQATKLLDLQADYQVLAAKFKQLQEKVAAESAPKPEEKKP